MAEPMPGALPSLDLSDFPAYFAAVWHEPDAAPVSAFPWQLDLVERVHRDRRWPSIVDLPTGSGKTSLLDIALFLLALDAGSHPEQRWHPRRIALVVDRRVIVDQAAERSAQLAARLSAASDGVLRRVADRLRSLAPAPDGSLSDRPLATANLRGGIIRDESWAHHPDRPAVLASTVDQVGSRLLFRGYGVSRGMRPVQAGLLGHDVLYLLDEVHLARPFAETLDAVGWLRSIAPEGRYLPDRWQVVRLSATVDDEGARFPGRPLDTTGHPVLARRLGAAKPARLVQVPTPADPARANQKLAAECAVQAKGLLGAGARTIAVIVNRVDTARRVYSALHDPAADRHVVLLTGRMRPVDRDRVLAGILDRVRLGRVRSQDDPPLILVTTQSIEAGADFDLDAVVTECASLDALRQRFGRVDRDGRLSASGSAFTSVVLASLTSIAEGVIDPVYGAALGRTWAWLTELDAPDFGLTTLPVPEDPVRLRELLPPRHRAPVLLPSHLDRWARTSDYGVAADPDVAHWLHGIEASASATDVSVVWREDLDEELLAHAGRDGSRGAAVRGRLDALPPLAAETLAVPLAAFRRWAAGQPPDLALGDVWAVTEPAAPPPGPDRAVRSVLRWRDDQSELVPATAIGPGDTVVVPASWGGLTAATWDPEAQGVAPDVADEAYAGRPGRRTIVRLSYAQRDRLARTDAERPPPPLPDPELLAELSAADRRAEVGGYADALAAYAGADDGPDPDTELLARLTGLERPSLAVIAERSRGGRILESYVVSGLSTQSRPSTDPYSGLAEEDGQDGASYAGQAVGLADHLDGVRRWADQFGGNLGLPTGARAAVARAGLLHDLGKLDPRFQLLLNGGSELARQGHAEPLAKSDDTGDRAARRRAAQVSGYPRGQRHELLSTRLAEVAAGDDPEWDLVAHLVASHHGFGRYRFPAQTSLDQCPITFRWSEERVDADSAVDLDRLDAGIPDRFGRQLRRWGWFGLAYLEAVLRLADHEESRAPGVTAAVRRVDHE